MNDFFSNKLRLLKFILLSIALGNFFISEGYATTKSVVITQQEKTVKGKVTDDNDVIFRCMTQQVDHFMRFTHVPRHHQQQGCHSGKRQLCWDLARCCWGLQAAHRKKSRLS